MGLRRQARRLPRQQPRTVDRVRQADRGPRIHAPRPPAHLRHGLRRLGASERAVGRILGHKAIAGTIAVSGIYDRFDRLPEIRTALTAWSDYVAALIREEEKQGEVVDFGRAAAASA